MNLQVTFRDMAPSQAVGREVREKAEKLAEFHSGILSCRVAIEAMTRRHHRGNVYRVRVDLTVPGEEIVVGRDCSEDHAHEDVYVAIRDAFDGARRLLQDHARKQRSAVKTHEPRGGSVRTSRTTLQPPEMRLGKVARIFPDAGYGFLETEDGRDVYFHAHSVLKHGFSKLAVGMEVRYEEEEGERGPQASSVCIVAKDGRHAA